MGRIYVKTPLAYCNPLPQELWFAQEEMNHWKQEILDVSFAPFRRDQSLTTIYSSSIVYVAPFVVTFAMGFLLTQ